MFKGIFSTFFRSLQNLGALCSPVLSLLSIGGARFFELLVFSLSASLLFALPAGAECSAREVGRWFDPDQARELSCRLDEEWVCIDGYGNSLLSKSIVNGNYPAAHYLLDCGTTVSNKGDPLILAMSYGFGRPEVNRELVEDLRLLRRISAKISEVNLADEYGNTAFFLILESVCRLPEVTTENLLFDLRGIFSEYGFHLRSDEGQKVIHLKRLADFAMYDRDCIDLLVADTI